MKRRIVTCITSFVLLICMLIPLVPAASAETRLAYDWTGEQYEREGERAYKFALDEVLYNCYGFVIEYKISEITAGTFSDKMTLEVCVGDTAGNWAVAELFALDEEDIGVYRDIQVALERPANIKYLAIISRDSNGASFSYNLGIKDPVYYPEFAPWGHEGYFTDQKFSWGTSITYPLVLDQPLEDCMGFMLHYQLLQINDGIFNQNTSYDVFVQNSAKSWSLVHTFNMREDEAMVDIVLNSPMDITQVAVIAKATGKNSYRHYFAITDAFTMQDYLNDCPYFKTGPVAAHMAGRNLSMPEGNASPLVLQQPLINCKSFILDYELTELNGTTLNPRSRCVVYYRNGAGKWNKVKDFAIPAGYSTVEVKLSRADTVTQVAVFFVPGVNGVYSYRHRFEISSPVW